MGPSSFDDDSDYISRGRPLKEVLVEDFPKVNEVIPSPLLNNVEIILTIAEYEAMRLVDLEGLNQDQAGELMNVSRGTIWRLLESGRQKILLMVTQGKKIIIENQCVLNES